MPLRKFLQHLPQTQETVDELNIDIECARQALRFNINLLRDKILNSLERKKAEDSISYIEKYIEDVEKVRNKV
jgi:hypothetical protein